MRSLFAAGLLPLALPLALALASCRTAEPTPTPQKPTTQDVVKQALPSVVLLLNRQHDGKLGFGSGLIVGDGLVLTNLHVVANSSGLSAMLYKPGRVTYSKMDGGLGRFVFENQRDVVNATLVRGDPALDLAVVRLEATTGPAKLAFRDSAPEPGEPVLALGHPNENVWSFTSGVVSATPNGLIQHDAAINKGNSGGPLIDSEGRVVGINTSKLFGESEGVAYARPISLGKYLLGEVTAPFEPDLSTPEKAVMTCVRAQELASPALVRCVDWDSFYDRASSALTESLDVLKLPAPLRAKVGEHFRDRKAVIATRQRAMLQELRGENLETSGGNSSKDLWALLSPDVQAEVERRIALYRNDETLDRKLVARNGYKLEDRRDFKRQLLKMGVRVEQVKVAGDAAWVSMTGRNVDGSEYRCSALWHRIGNDWSEEWWPTAEALRTLPLGFPPPLTSWDDVHELALSEMLIELSGRAEVLPWNKPQGPQQASPTSNGSSGEVSGQAAP